MNKTIIININSIVFHIEEDAYETLRAYMIEIKRHFGKSEDSREILEDIENRIAEMFSEFIQTGRKEVINSDDVQQVIDKMGKVSDFETMDAIVDADDEQPAEERRFKDQADDDRHFPETEYFAKKLMRDPDDKILGGVCSGLGHYFGIDPKWVRVIFVLFFLFAGSGVLLYAVLWMVMPMAHNRSDKMAMRGEAPNLQNFKKNYERELEEQKDHFSEDNVRLNKKNTVDRDFIRVFFRVLGRILGFFALFVIGSGIIGLFIAFAYNCLFLMGYDNLNGIDGLNYLAPVSAFFALLAGYLAISIPLFALFFIVIRAMYSVAPMNSYGSLTMFAVWILSIIAIIYFSISTAQSFRESSTIKTEKRLEAKPVYVLSQHNVRVIDAGDIDFFRERFKIEPSENNIRNLLRSDISIDVESLDSLEKPFVQYHYSAKGRTFKDASNRASEIVYHLEQKSNDLIFDSHFSVTGEEIFRDQHVKATLFLPIGTKVIIKDDIGSKVTTNIWIHDCKVDDDDKSTEWVVTKRGLECTYDKDKKDILDENDVDE